MENPLSKLALDAWYKVLIVIGTFVVLLNGAGLLPNYPTKQTFLIGLGCIIYGVGEWINHPLNETVQPRTATTPTLKWTDHSWNPRPFGLLFDGIGICLLVWGFYKLI